MTVPTKCERDISDMLNREIRYALERFRNIQVCAAPTDRDRPFVTIAKQGEQAIMRALTRQGEMARELELAERSARETVA